MGDLGLIQLVTLGSIGVGAVTMLFVRNYWRAMISIAVLGTLLTALIIDHTSDVATLSDASVFAVGLYIWPTASLIFCVPYLFGALVRRLVFPSKATGASA